jgi:NifB/MoaA-like Fe-S oxidoreductase
LNNFQKKQASRLPKSLPKATKATLVTAMLASQFIQENIVSRLAQINNFIPELAVVKNNFYGESITVTGLLTGQDIFAALQGRDLGAAAFLPQSCLNDNQIFLDDWKLSEMSEKLGVPVIPLHNDFSQIFAVLKQK